MPKQVRPNASYAILNQNNVAMQVISWAEAFVTVPVSVFSVPMNVLKDHKDPA